MKLEEGLEQCNSDTIQHMILRAQAREEQRKKQAKVCSTVFVLGEGCAADGYGWGEGEAEGDGEAEDVRMRLSCD